MKDDWLTAAMTDDAVVVELLFLLKQSPSPSAACTPPHPTAKKLLNMALPSPSWGHRQPRSKPAASSCRKDTAAGSTARFSPTTPLSWSGGAASPSDGGVDESSRLPSSSDLTSAYRSKVTFTNETGNVGNFGRGSIRKKTFADLMEEENSLMKDRVHLKRELASLHVTLNQQIDRSKDFKRRKIDLNQQSACDTGVQAPDARGPAPSGKCNNPMEHATTRPVLSSDSHTTQKPVEAQNKGFILPDLNVAPMEDESGSGWN